jgi:hypothetical protein
MKKEPLGKKTARKSDALKSERDVAWDAGSSLSYFRSVVLTEAMGTFGETTLPLEEWRSLTG